MDTTRINRVEIINHTVPLEEGGGRAYVYWDTKNKSNIELSVQDSGKTLKIFISRKD